MSNTLLHHRKKKNLSNRRWKWGKDVAEADMIMEKHILPKLACDILLPIEELDTMADRRLLLGKRGEDIYAVGTRLGYGEAWKQKIIRSCLKLEQHVHVLADMAETLNRGPLPMFPTYDSIFVTTESILTTEEKVNEVFRGMGA